MKRTIYIYGIFLVFLLAIGSQAGAQETNVVGRVTTFKKYGLNKVAIEAKKTGTKTVTDTAGYYNIKCQTDDKLVFEANGFFKETINLKRVDADSVNVDMKLKNGDKNFKLATGYGYIDKDKLSYAIQHIGSEKDYSSYNSVLDIIRDELTGGRVGTNSIQLRGYNTYGSSGPTTPLIVVDGSVVEPSYLKNIATSQVKSVDVLKGAAASARYGSRGMNGVIVIETKSKN